MPGVADITQEFVHFAGLTNTENAKTYAVCKWCGFRGDSYTEDNVLDCGKLGSTRSDRKYNHLQACNKVSNIVRNKYNIFGEDKSKLGNNINNNQNRNKLSLD